MPEQGRQLFFGKGGQRFGLLLEPFRQTQGLAQQILALQAGGHIHSGGRLHAQILDVDRQGQGSLMQALPQVAAGRRAAQQTAQRGASL